MSEIDSGDGQMDRELTASQMLSEARERLGLSQKDVADQLFLTPSYIRYIDDENFDKIPNKAFVRGYLRSYARVVKLSGDDVVFNYNQSLKSHEVEQVSEEDLQGKVTPDINSSIVKAGLFGFIALLFVIAVVWLLSSGDDSRSIDDNETIESGLPSVGNVDRDKVFPAPSSPAAISSPTGPVITTPATTNLLSDPDSATVSPLESEAEEEISTEAGADNDRTRNRTRILKDVVVERSRENEVDYIIWRAGGKDEVEFVFDDECWLEIEDGEGAMIYSDLNRAGEVLKVYGIAPFDILLGKVSAVTVQFNSEKVDLESRARIRNDATATLRLGS